MNSQLIGEDLMLGKTESKRRGVTEDEMVGWHHQLMSLSKLRRCEGRGMLESCSPWGRKESDRTERLNNNNTLTDTRFPKVCRGRDGLGNKYGQAGVVSSTSACQATQAIISKTDWLHPSWGFIYFQKVCAYKNTALQPK